MANACREPMRTGWSLSLPCLLLWRSCQDVLVGFALLLAYTFGRVMPVLAAASATGSMKQLLSLRKYSRWMNRSVGLSSRHRNLLPPQPSVSGGLCHGFEHGQHVNTDRAARTCSFELPILKVISEASTVSWYAPWRAVVHCRDGSFCDL